MELLFEKMTLNDNDNVIFDKDCGLNNKNLILNGSSKKYIIEKDGLHEKGSDGKTGQMVFKFKTDAK